METPADDPAERARDAEQLRRFRSGFYRCLSGWADTAFELCDAALCAPAPIASVPVLSLEPIFRRSHGSLYKALARGNVDADAMRDLLVEHRPASWPLVFAVDASTWARCDRRDQPRARVLLLRVQTLSREAHRRRLVLPVGHGPGLGQRLLDRPHGRPPNPAKSRCH
jgi:hypothetical protein